MNKINFNIMKIKMFITSYFPLYIILLALQIKKYPIVFNIDAIFVPATIFATVLIVYCETLTSG